MLALFLLELDSKLFLLEWEDTWQHENHHQAHDDL